MAGMTTRSQVRSVNGNNHKTNGHSQNGHTVPENGKRKANGHNIQQNGSHYKQKVEDKSGHRSYFRTIFDTVLFPFLLMVWAPQMSMLYWYIIRSCDGTYSGLLGMFREKSVVAVLTEMWTSLDIVNYFTVGVTLGYFTWSIFFMVVLPGKPVHGPITPKGNIPVYKDNGFLNYIVTMTGFAILTFLLKMNGMTPTIVYDRFGDLLAFINIFALFFVLFLYFKGLYAPSSTDSGKTGGGFLFDYYWGTELYPRVFGIDIKVLTNCRFGMTVWPLLVCIYALKSYELHGFTDSVFVTSVLQLAYITKFFIWESGYMGTIDIIVDRAGFYICWGCLCWLPSLYPNVSQYLVTHPQRLGPMWTTLILAFGIISIAVNYLADRQRQLVRKANGKCLVWGKKPNLIHAKYVVETGEEKTSILLASGWWGLSRHFHYIPEILLSFFWTLPCGFDSIFPYTYVIYLTLLLVHRSHRDEEKCRAKYGKYWKEYCAQVPNRIVPYLY